MLVYIKRLSSCFLLLGVALGCSIGATCEEEQLEFAHSKYPVSINFLVADIKYTPDGEVRICEIQQGIISSYKGDNYLHGGHGVISQNFHSYLEKWGLHAWAKVPEIREDEIKRLITEDSESWSSFEKIEDLQEDATLKALKKQPIYDPYSISDYHGLLFARPRTIKSLSKFHKKYPGLIPIGERSFKYWVDKCKMNRFLDEVPEISKLRPKWNSYPKKYKKTLSDRIVNDIQSNILVIKPRGSFRGRGVIIVDKENLDQVLKKILKKTEKLENHPDPSYNYWYKDSFDTFIVEEFVPSMPVTLDDVDGLLYDTTMRITFFLVYEKNIMTIFFTGAYNKFPLLPLTEEGTLNEKHKSFCREPYFSLPDQDVFEDVKRQLTKPLLLCFKKMLK